MKKIEAITSIFTTNFRDRNPKNDFDLHEIHCENAKTITFAVAHIEHNLAAGIGRFFFGEQTTEREDFSDLITDTDFFSYSAKRKTFLSICRRTNILKGPEFAEIEKYTSKVMKYRNMFTHGKPVYTNLGCELHYFEGTKKTKLIDDDLLQTIESDLELTFRITESAMVKIEKQYA